MSSQATTGRIGPRGDDKGRSRLWGPYLSERQWGTVREDYSVNGDAWAYFPHDHARSRAYRWGEDGLGGICDEKQRLCFALALWNGRDPILKERAFGLTNGEGNHGEDVKEYYFYLDGTPSHSYLKYLYKYPQAAFPYNELVAVNRDRGRQEFEYELLDTGVFDDDKYFDVTVEYAKAAHDDVRVRITVVNRGPDEATAHVLPTLWFRNTWSWTDGAAKPRLSAADEPEGTATIRAEHPELGGYELRVGAPVPLLFTENETDNERLFGSPNASPYVKDGIGRAVVDGDPAAVNPAREGTKAAAHHTVTLPAGGTETLRLRLAPAGTEPAEDFDTVFRDRIAEADAFYAELTPRGAGEDEARVLRQALAGMLWTKQYYGFDLEAWLAEHGLGPWSVPRTDVRNREWFHMVSDDIISMPDKWEYPWFAAWDLAFHAVALSAVDVPFAKEQLELLLRGTHLHPNGQIPAYEWNFGDVNPPVHAWAAYFVYTMEQIATGHADVDFLERVFQKLLTNFTWWVNRKDPSGRNVFQGGFLGLDNIGVFDRSAPLPTGGQLEQADGTAWMALYCQSMLQIALELVEHNPAYEDLILKFVEHYLWIAAAMDRVGDLDDGLWDEEDGFYYDVLRLPDGQAVRLKVRSMVGLLPLCASTVFQPQQLARVSGLGERLRRFADRHPSLSVTLASAGAGVEGGPRLLSVVDEKKLTRVLSRLLSEDEFLGPYGIRALSRHHAEHPYRFWVHGQEYQVAYLPAESDSGMFGGNSNWRGPVWFPVNALLIRGLLNLYGFYGDDFTVECPEGSGVRKNLFEVAKEIADRLTRTFLRGEDGRRPVYGGQEKFQSDPHWRDLILFPEYFHGDNGAGLGASHQTGWTGLVAALMKLFGTVEPGDFRGGLARRERP
ncbi:MGH1-like glycoside hydrolase domain-containing protein [Streptomyces flavofungini]|uniref:MGH1-like glycoside hydrolase domain-containing protein n=1 Tax=Streptomyces flavofungini TaxID=68200 RepID=UPI0025B0A612|nr:glucosidase [Streptomyces flavofungini]WJV50645.1 glucosidase [Streptomyces flavofungini]